MPTTKTITIQKNHLLLILGAVVAACVLGAVYFTRAAFVQPDFAPADSDQDFAQNILGANNADNEFNSNAVTGNPDGSLIERLQGIQDDYVYNNFTSLTKPQRYQVYDDWNCANNNEEGASSCAAGDAEYTGEEGEWTYYYDSDLNGATIASSTVYKDERTGLYWSDCYDDDSGGGACLAIANNFHAAVSICTDAEINAGTCDISARATTSAAMTFCQNLELDKDGDGTDDTDWYLPSQKELLLAYINGAANNLPHVTGDYYWSSTESYNGPTSAWDVYLSFGYTFISTKTFTNYVRCIHR